MEKKQRILVCGSPDAANDVAAVCSVIDKSRTLSSAYEAHNVSERAGVDFMVENGDGFHPDDILVLLLGDNYGNIVSDGLSMPHLLAEQAGNDSLRRLVFVKSTEHVGDRQRDFLDSLSSHLVRARYETSDEAVKGVVGSLSLTKCGPCDYLTPRDVVGALCTSVEWDEKSGQFVSTTGKKTAGSGSLLFETAKHLDLFIKKTDPKDEDETFKLNIQMDDLDTERLAALVEAENRYLAKEGRRQYTLPDFLKQHRFAAPDGRIYDRAFYLFPKSPLAAFPPEEDPKKEEQKRLEKLKNDAIESLRSIEDSLEHDLEFIEGVEKTADDATITKLTHQAFCNVYDDFKLSFVPAAKKYGDTDEPDYLDTYSLGITLKRICRICTRHRENLINTCEKCIDALEDFIKHPMSVRNDMLPDGVPESFMDLMDLLLPPTKTDDGKVPATKEDLNAAFQLLAAETHKEGRATRKTIKIATAKPKKPKKDKKAVRRGTSPFAGKGKIRGCIEVSAKCDAITVNGRLYDKITGYEVWERINRLLKPFSECDETPIPFTSKDRLHFHRGKAKQFLDDCIETIKEGRKIVKALIKPSLVPAYQREDEESGEAAKKPKFRKT